MALGDTRTIEAIIKAKNEAAAAIGEFRAGLVGVAAAAAAVSGAILLMQKAISASVEAASDQEQADVRLAAALRTLGQNTAEVRNELNEFASDLQSRLGIADDQIQAVIATLSQFGRLAGEELKRATRATLDYAAATGQDAKSAALALSKAMEGGTARLAGIALKFDEGSTKAQRFEQIMGAIEKTTGGTAQALGNTFAGAVDRAALAFDELKEAIGDILIKNPAIRQVIEEWINLLNSLTGQVKNNEQAVSGWISTMVGGAARLAEVALDMVVLLDKTNLLSAAFHAATSPAVALKDVMMAMAHRGEELKPITDALRASLQRVQEAAKLTADDATDVAASLGTGEGGVAKAGTEAAEALDQIAQSSLVEQVAVFAELETIFLSINDAIRIFVEDGVEGLEEALSQVGVEVETLRQSIGVALRGEGVNAALSFGDVLVDAAMGAKVSFQDFFKAMLADLAKALVRALALRAILAAATGGGSEINPLGAVALGGGTFGMQHGGEVRGGVPGLDSVHAMLTPGEIVLPTNQRDNFEAMAAFAKTLTEGRGAASGASAAPGMTLQAVILPRRDEAEMASMIDDLNRFVERRGYRLAATHIVNT